MDKNQLGQVAAGGAMAYGAHGLTKDIPGGVGEIIAFVVEVNDGLWSKLFGPAAFTLRFLTTILLATTWTYCLTHNTDCHLFFVCLIWGAAAFFWAFCSFFSFLLLFFLTICSFLLDIILVFFVDEPFNRFSAVVGWLPGMFWPGLFFPESG